MAALMHLVVWCAVWVTAALLWRAGAGVWMGMAVVAALAAALWTASRIRRAARRRRSSLQYVQMAKQPIALG